MKPTACIISLLAITASGLAVADGKPTPTETVKIDFTTLDKDANGNLTREEVKAVTELTGQFDTLDADHDLSLSRVEFQRWHRASTGGAEPRDPTTVPGGSAGAQHMPERD